MNIVVTGDGTMDWILACINREASRELTCSLFQTGAPRESIDLAIPKYHNQSLSSDILEIQVRKFDVNQSV